MGDADGSFHLVDVLAAGAGRAKGGYVQIIGINDNRLRLNKREDGDGGGRSVNAARAFGRGDALDAVDA